MLTQTSYDILDDIMKNPLELLKDMFSGLKKTKYDAFVGIDIGSSSIKLAQLKKEKGIIVLETYGEVALGPYEERFAGEITNLPPEKLAEALKNLIEQAGVTAHAAFYAISSAASLIFILSLPKVNDAEISSVVTNEARKYIPVPLSEVSLDWWVIPEKRAYSDEEKEVSDSIDVLVAVVRNEMIDRYTTINESIGSFSQAAFEIETFSAIRASLQHELTPVMIIDMGASGSRLSIIEHGVVRKFYSVARGSAYFSSSLAKSLELDFDKAEALKKDVGLDASHEQSEAYNIIATGMEYIFTEIQNVMFDFEKDYQKPISKIVLSGGAALTKNFKEQLEEKYKIRVELADPFKKAESPEFLDDVLAEAGPEFAVAVGLALQNME